MYRPTGARFDGRKPLQDPLAAVALIRELIASDNREHFAAFYLDSRHRLLAYQCVHIGTLNQSLVHPREVFQPAVLIGAHAILILHNHPSGQVTPSAEDREVTRRLVEAGGILGIRVLDHIIWSWDGAFSSFAQDGLMPSERRS